MTDFIRIDTNPVPEGGEPVEFHGADGAFLRAAIFPAREPRACAVLMAGRSEFIEKYFEVIKDLQARGFNVATMDWRGQGLSERMLPIREKGHIQDFDIYKADLRRFTEQVAMTRFAGPYVLMTHSMGGAPGLQLLADGYEKFVGAVLSAPMTRLFDDLAKRVGARAMARLGCALGASRHSVLGVKEYSLDFEGNVLTSDRDRHERFRALQAEAPNAAIREPTYGWLRAALAAMDDLHRPGRFEGLKVPVRIISAELDYLVSSRDHKWLAQQSPLIDCITIKGSMHEIMMERDECRNQYWAAFDEFVEPLIASQKSAKR